MRGPCLSHVGDLLISRLSGSSYRSGGLSSTLPVAPFGLLELVVCGRARKDSRESGISGNAFRLLCFLMILSGTFVLMCIRGWLGWRVWSTTLRCWVPSGIRARWVSGLRCRQARFPSRKPRKGGLRNSLTGYVLPITYPEHISLTWSAHL